MVVWAKAMPRSAIIWTRSRELSLNVRYHRTHRTMISWSKCRPLKRSCAEVGSVIRGVIARHRAFQQFAPEPPTFLELWGVAYDPAQDCARGDVDDATDGGNAHRDF